MTLRIGVDLDGTLADLSSMYHEYEDAMFGQHTADDVTEAPDRLAEQTEALPKPLSDKERLKAARERSGRQDVIWRALKATPDFWTSLKPLEDGAVRQLWTASREHNWEIFFITQRPQTAGATVQAQTQRWLIAHGFETPSVLTLSGSRGKTAFILDLDFLIDDLPKNCVDVISDSKCCPILVLRTLDEKAGGAARAMNIGVVRSVAEAIAMMSNPQVEPRVSAVKRVFRALGLHGRREK